MDAATVETLTCATRAAVLRHRSVASVELVGSRARGTANALSDVDLLVETSDFDAVRADLPTLLAPLQPLAAQWDRLSEEATYYMVVLPGALKVDLVFDVAPQLPGPWRVTAETLAPIDAHFWDWVLWLAAKENGGDHELVERQVREPMFEHILAPLGVAVAPTSLGSAVDAYLRARTRWERRFGATVDTRLGDAVLSRIRALTAPARP